VPDGPLQLHSELEIHMSGGVVRETRAALCRCGASSNKPFCDNSHVKVEFRHALATGAAVDAGVSASGPLRVSPQTNGPYVIEGACMIVDHQGALCAQRGPRISLCRCGRSANKPFCDGSHQRTGFTAE
jgi:CDGSH-type Zn-finger protein